MTLAITFLYFCTFFSKNFKLSLCISREILCDFLVLWINLNYVSNVGGVYTNVSIIHLAGIIKNMFKYKKTKNLLLMLWEHKVKRKASTPQAGIPLGNIFFCPSIALASSSFDSNPDL